MLPPTPIPPLAPRQPRDAARTMPSILRRILDRRREQVSAAERGISVEIWKERAGKRRRRDFLAALRASRPGLGSVPAVIAELKRASPSRGQIRSEFDVPTLAAGYQAAGAAALSVLTEETHFDGRLAYLEQARAATRLPILRKDFTFCPYQIWEAAGAGADAVLLIAAMLDDATWGELIAVSREAGLAAVSEVHDGVELERALRLGADCVGVNNRDLNTFTVDIERAIELGRRMPPGAVTIAESGLRTHADLTRMRAAGYDAVLIGESFMAAPHPGRALARALGGFIKVCGLLTPADARAAAAAGADAAGFVFAPSPRQTTPAQARATIAALPESMLRVGVFRGAAVDAVLGMVRECGLDRVQLHGPYAAAEGAALAVHVPVWRAMAMPGGEEAEEVGAWAPFTERFLLDSAVNGRTGGNGVTLDWDAVPQLQARHPAARWIVAGGLQAANVAAAVQRSRAFAVDAASGLESEPGKKDPAAVAAFVRAARAAFLEMEA